MQETIIYGGSFNPPTLAHQAVIDACQRYHPSADVWVMPSGTRKDKALTMPLEHRLGMVAAATTCRIETGELYANTVTQTAQSVARLRNQYPGRQFTYVFGADSYQSMNRWAGGAVLQQCLPMLLVPRSGYSLNIVSSNAAVLPVITPDISSSLVRERIAQQLPIHDLVSPAVAGYIQQHHLYEQNYVMGV